jgi:hypothetical protein
LAIDFLQLTENLHRTYDFTAKTVLFVGAGGRQLFDLRVKTKKLIAIDQNSRALAQLKEGITTLGSQTPMEVIPFRFEDVFVFGDVVYFEFCLHEMTDPRKTLTHAQSLAPEIIVFDHSVGSEWVFYAAEEEKVRRSAKAMEKFGIRRRAMFCTNQLFKNQNHRARARSHRTRKEV